MKYTTLEKMARELDAKEIDAGLRSLMNDNRFAAVVRIIIDQRALADLESCQLRFANSHGALAHAAGVRYGLLELENRLRQTSEPPKRRGMQEGHEPPTEPRRVENHD
jgi:hypothetical protein